MIFGHLRSDRVDQDTDISKDRIADIRDRVRVESMDLVKLFNRELVLRDVALKRG